MGSESGGPREFPTEVQSFPKNPKRLVQFLRAVALNGFHVFEAAVRCTCSTELLRRCGAVIKKTLGWLVVFFGGDEILPNYMKGL